MMTFIKAAADMAKSGLKISKPVRYSIAILVIVLVGFVAVKLDSIYNHYSWKKNTKESAEAKLKGEVNEIQKEILSIEQLPQNLAYVLEFSNPDKDEIEMLLKAVVENNDEIFGVCIAFEPNKYNKDTTFYAPYYYKKNGNIVSVNPSDTTDYYFSEDWYLIPKILNKGVWIEPYFDEGATGGNTVLSTFSVPFYSYNGKNETMTGIIAVDISVDWISKTVSSINLYDKSYSFLVSENGTIISAPNPEWPYNESLFSLADEMKLPVLRKIGRDLQQGKSGFVNVGKLDNKRKYWICYMPIPANKWGVLLVVPQE
jgi:sigma-B regulation protein RsbU (phosphoserine phosphatase)